MIREPIYDTVEDARRGKVSRAIKVKIARTKTPKPEPKTYTRKVNLSAKAQQAAEDRARDTLERLASKLQAEVSF